MDETGAHYTEWSKPEREVTSLYEYSLGIKSCENSSQVKEGIEVLLR